MHNDLLTNNSNELVNVKLQSYKLVPYDFTIFFLLARPIQSALFALPEDSLAEFHSFRDRFLQRLIILQSSVINERPVR